MSNLKIIISEDGSSTIFNETLNETYHSTHGAITESKHVFIKHGLEFGRIHSQQLEVLEIGMGTGLNLLLSLEYSLQHSFPINYHTLEPFPLSQEIINQLNYEREINNPLIKGELIRIHEYPWETEVKINEHFILNKTLCKLESFKPSKSFDLIFFDAFAPKKQPEMWDLQNFTKLFSLVKPGGFLVSYCANGQFKRNLKQAGFTIESLPGPPGKFEMTRAYK